MLQLTIELPEMLSQQVKSSGLSRQQLGRVMIYLLEMYLKVEESQEFIQVAALDDGRQNHTEMQDASTSITDILAGSLGPMASDELDYFNIADVSWQRFAFRSDQAEEYLLWQQVEETHARRRRDPKSIVTVSASKFLADTA